MSRCTRCLTVLDSGTRLTQIVCWGVGPVSSPSPLSWPCHVRPSTAAQNAPSRAGSPASRHKSLNRAIAMGKNLARDSPAVVLVVAAEEVERVVRTARLVPPSRRPVEPLVHAPKAVQAARVGRVRVVDGSVLERERAHARALAHVGRPVGARRCGPRVERPAHVLRRRPHGRLAEVVLEGARALLLLGEGDVEVVVEVAPGRGGPGEAPAHPPLVALQLLERSVRHCPEHHVVVGQVDGRAVEAVRDRRAGGAACGVVGPEHEVVGEQLQASPEQIGERRLALVGLEDVLLVDPDPGQFPTPQRQFVAAPGQLLLGLEQLQPCGKPFYSCSGLVTGHCLSPSCRYIIGGGVSPGTCEGAMTITSPSAAIASASGTSMAAFAGSNFWAPVRTAITTIQNRLMTPRATSIAISPTLEPAQHSPNPSPEPASSRQRWRKCRLTGVSS